MHIELRKQTLCYVNEYTRASHDSIGVLTSMTIGTLELAARSSDNAPNATPTGRKKATRTAGTTAGYPTESQ